MERFLAGRQDLDRGWVTCVCGKRGYYRKKEAKRISRQMPSEVMDVFPCRYPGGAGWHLGHLPKGVSWGIYSRQELA